MRRLHICHENLLNCLVLLGLLAIALWAIPVAASPFAYVTNAGSNDVSGYKINVSTGALTPMPGSPFASRGPFSVAVDPTGKFAYVTNIGDNTVSGYTINASTGALTPIPGSPFVAG